MRRGGAVVTALSFTVIGAKRNESYRLGNYVEAMLSQSLTAQGMSITDAGYAVGFGSMSALSEPFDQ